MDALCVEKRNHSHSFAYIENYLRFLQLDIVQTEVYRESISDLRSYFKHQYKTRIIVLKTKLDEHVNV